MIQNKGLRKILKAVRYTTNKQIHERLKIPPTNVYIHKRLKKITDKLEQDILYQSIKNLNEARHQTILKKFPTSVMITIPTPNYNNRNS